MTHTAECKQGTHITKDSASLDSTRLPTYNKNIEAIEAYRGKLLSFACHLTQGNKDTAEDITQETLLKSIQKIHTLKDENLLENWLQHTLYYTFVTHTRKPHIKKTISMNKEGIDFPDQTDYQEEILSSLDKNLIDYFSDRRIAKTDQDLLDAFYLKEQTTKQITQSLGLPFTTTKSRVDRAQRRLKKLIKEDRMIQQMEENKLFSQR